jgi:peptidoglycan/xylan/chitin deacetylase (PgdA/CDA1 family)
VKGSRELVLKPPPRGGLPVLYVVACVLVFSAAVAVAWGVSAPSRVLVDGVVRTVAPGSTIQDLVQQRYILSTPGALLSVRGGVLRIYGGDPISFTRNRRPVTENQPLFDGDVVTSASGANRTEPVVTARVSIPAAVQVQGSGAILKLSQQGQPETDDVKRGGVSGSIVSSRTVTAALPMMFVAWLPVSTHKLVALTFDDGPWPGQTDKILDILKAEKVHGTFFMLGQEARDHPALAKQVATDGNQVGNHTTEHRDLTQLRPSEVTNELVGGAARIKAATGVAPSIVRPPFGHFDSTVLRQARAARQTVVLWNVDTQDWTRPGTGEILANAKREMVDDAIVLMHDGGGDQAQTVQALRPLIVWLKSRGYTFVTIKQMEEAR